MNGSGGGAAARGGRARILVIDDEPSVAELIRDVLRRVGFHVETSSGGEESLSQAIRGDYGLVISDFAIPGMNGLEFARRFGLERPDVRVLIISAFLDHETIDALQEEPAVAGLMRKPFDIFELVQKVESALPGAQATEPPGMSSFGT